MKRNRAYCPLCSILICGLCGPSFFNIQVPISNPRPVQFDQRGLLQEQQHYIIWCDSEIRRLQNELLNAEQASESWKQKYLDSIHDELERSKLEQMAFDRKGKGILIEEDHAHFLLSDTTQKILSAESLGPQKKTKNMLYNLIIELIIPEVTPFTGDVSTTTTGRYHCIEEERLALLDLKTGIFGADRWLSSWNGKECCGWSGVECNATTGHVVKVKLRYPYPI